MLVAAGRRRDERPRSGAPSATRFGVASRPWSCRSGCSGAARRGRGRGRGHAAARRRATPAPMFVIDWAYTAMTQVDSLVIGAVLGDDAGRRLPGAAAADHPARSTPASRSPRPWRPGCRGAAERPTRAAFERALRYAALPPGGDRRADRRVRRSRISIERPRARVRGVGRRCCGRWRRSSSSRDSRRSCRSGINYLGEARRRIPIAVIAAVLSTSALDLVLVPELGDRSEPPIASDVALVFYTGAHLVLCRRLDRAASAARLLGHAACAAALSPLRR